MPKPEKIPPCPAAPTRRSTGLVTRDYSICLITPVFGGGVVAGEPDKSFPIRGTSIRGQLQFWWRATRGAAFASHSELFKRHGEVWGTTKKASPVELEVRDIHCDPPRPCARYTWNPRARGGRGGWSLHWDETLRSADLPYALFPFQGQPPAQGGPGAVPEKMPAEFIGSGSFIVRLRFPEALSDEVEAAVWAWVNFGGIGARTRRGCGSIVGEEVDGQGRVVKTLAPRAIADLRSWFRARAGEMATMERTWPTLPSTLLSHQVAASPIDAWNRIIGLWKAFRQGVGFARNPGQMANRPGRSRYPEPETIRELPNIGANRGLSHHQRLSSIPANGFPRAELGLPIVFHFQGRGEPPDVTLYPQSEPGGTSRERMASPLILKPLALGNNQAIPVIVRLLTPQLTGIELRQNNTVLSLPAATVVQDPRLAEYLNSPLAGSSSGSAIEAFMTFARSRNNGFTEL